MTSIKSLEELRSISINYLSEHPEELPFLDKEKLSIGDFVHLYMYSQGIKGIYTYEDAEEEKQFLTNLDLFFSNEEHRKMGESIIVNSLDFLIWVRKKATTGNIAIKDNRQILKQGLKLLHFINDIDANNTLQTEYKFQILLWTYCSFMETYKNVIPQEVLLHIFNSDIRSGKQRMKDYIQLGDFVKILSLFDKRNSVSSVIQYKFRNSIYHAKYLLEENKLKVYIDDELCETTRKEVEIRAIQVGMCVQFYISFCLRLFRSDEEIYNSNI